MEVTLDIELPLQAFDLPIPETPSRPIGATNADDAVTETNPEEFAIDADIFQGKVLSLGWKLLGNANTVDFFPLELDAERLPGTGCRIRLRSPFRILNKCLTVSEEDKTFVIDFITALGTHHTILIPAEWLIRRQESYPSLPEFHITRPMSFDLVTPRLMKAVNASTLVLSMADGSYIRLDRNSPRANVSQTTLTDTSVGAPISLARLFKPNKDRVPGQPSLSTTSAISMDVVSTDYFVTYSINNQVRLWSLRNNCCASLIEPKANLPLRMRAANIVTSRGNTVAVAFPSEIRVYHIDGEDNLVDDNDASISIGREFGPPFLHEIKLIDDNKMLSLLKSNASGQVNVIEHGYWHFVGGYNYSRTLEIPEKTSIAASKERVAQISLPILKIALGVLFPELGPEEVQKAIDDKASLDSLLSQLLAQLGTNDMSIAWLRLDTVCRELFAQASEVLCVGPVLSTESRMFFWNLKCFGNTIMSVDKFGEDHEYFEGYCHEATMIVRDLLGAVPSELYTTISNKVLSIALLMDRVDAVCDLLRPYIDQLKLNEIGRSSSTRVAKSLESYNKNYGIFLPVDYSWHDPNIRSVKLNELGLSAVSSLLHEYASIQLVRYQGLVSLAMIAFVEGWLVTDENLDLLRQTVECLRRFAIITEFKRKNLLLATDSVQLDRFGEALAREIISTADVVSLLSRVLPPFVPSISRRDYAEIETITGYCEPTPETVLLRSLAALAIGDEDTGIALAQQASLALPWPVAFEEKPLTQAAWFLDVARYSLSVGAKNAALWLAQYGESLSSRSDPRASELTEFVFKLSIEKEDIMTAYTALTRRFRGASSQDSESILLDEWIRKLFLAAAKKSPDTIRSLVVSYPFIGFVASLQKTLAASDSFATVPAYKLKYAWHVEHEDFVGAAQVLYDHIKSEPAMDSVRKAELYTICLNALAIANPESRWVSSGEQVVTYEIIANEQKAIIDCMASSL